MTQTKTEAATLTLTHHAAAPIGRVFQAFTDATELHKWFGHESFTVEDVHMDTRVGGDYRIAIRSPDGELFTVKGVIQRLSEPELIEYTWSWEEDDEAEEHESLVTISLTSSADGTDIELVHTQLASDESAGRHNEGWTSCFSSLDRYLSN